jgi:hypothetical protein
MESYHSEIWLQCLLVELSRIASPSLGGSVFFSLSEKIEIDMRPVGLAIVACAKLAADFLWLFPCLTFLHGDFMETQNKKA